MPLDLGQLLRLKGMVDAAATALEPDGASAPALTESYMRLRDQIGKLVAGDLSDEFNEAFPPIDVVAPSASYRAHEIAQQQLMNQPLARRARVLLGQLAGWIDGLIAEQTLEQRMRIEAEELAKRRPPGFSAA